ncbi:hypothetical protein FOMPIDRAFT_1052798 [Fomitopsis schrenkii]|uniref:Uncharacterized protein n=1 Tax=Fomitopsis schrenkii TaxID=2126942 RepID=S8DWF0_FOMSC|nr:hypothetical protein FOMPIDRAFT_1052798 [Fomitopsis schrenkii]
MHTNSDHQYTGEQVVSFTPDARARSLCWGYAPPAAYSDVYQSPTHYPRPRFKASNTHYLPVEVQTALSPSGMPRRLRFPGRQRDVCDTMFDRFAYFYDSCAPPAAEKDDCTTSVGLGA